MIPDPVTLAKAEKAAGLFSRFVGWISDVIHVGKRRQEAQAARAERDQLQGEIRLLREIRDKDDTIRELRQQIAAREQESMAKEKARYAFNAVWFGPTYDEQSGPFCQACWAGGAGQPVHMMRHDFSSGASSAQCGKCRAQVKLWREDQRPSELPPPPSPPPEQPRRRRSSW